MKKLFTVLIIVLSLAVFGCGAQKKPVTPNTKEKVIPAESNIGYSLVDQDQAPASVKKMITSMSDMESAAWATVGNISYIILNPEEKNETLKISEVVQRVPVKNFLWLDVKLVEDETKADTGSQLKIYKLEKTDKAVDAVGFRYTEAEEAKNKEQAKTTPTPAPAPAPAPSANNAAPKVQPKTTQQQPQNIPQQPAPGQNNAPEQQPQTLPQGEPPRQNDNNQ